MQVSALDQASHNTPAQSHGLDTVGVMPVEPHPAVTPPADDAVLWRYMNLAKYLDLLQRAALWLARADQLGDPFEGHFTDAAVKASRTLWEAENLDPDILSRDDGTVSPTALRRIGQIASQVSLINCWHNNAYESAALWSQYADTHGLAIVSTTKRLQQALEKSDKKLALSCVRYIDFDTEVDQAPVNLVRNITQKRRSFEHEHEVRLIFMQGGSDNPPMGMHAEVDLDTLIERVVVSPYAAEWYREVVTNVSRHYGIQCEVATSRLAERPIM